MFWYRGQLEKAIKYFASFLDPTSVQEIDKFLELEEVDQEEEVDEIAIDEQDYYSDENARDEENENNENVYDS